MQEPAHLRRTGGTPAAPTNLCNSRASLLEHSRQRGCGTVLGVRTGREDGIHFQIVRRVAQGLLEGANCDLAHGSFRLFGGNALEPQAGLNQGVDDGVADVLG